MGFPIPAGGFWELVAENLFSKWFSAIVMSISFAIVMFDHQMMVKY
jgi:hypothetical protein